MKARRPSAFRLAVLARLPAETRARLAWAKKPIEDGLERLRTEPLTDALVVHVAEAIWKPAQVFSDGDILIAATAAFHGHTLATADSKLAEGMRRISFPVAVHLIAME